MSAAEPADPIPPHVNTPGDAAVIDIRTRVGRQAATQRERGQRMAPTPRTGDNDGGGEPGSARALAEHFEATFNAHDLSLSDERTAQAFTVTLRIVLNVLAGAQANGVVDEGQQSELHQLIEGMMTTPGLIVG